MKRLSSVALLACLFITSSIPGAHGELKFDSESGQITAFFAALCGVRAIPEVMAINALNKKSKHDITKAAHALVGENGLAATGFGVGALAVLMQTNATANQQPDSSEIYKKLLGAAACAGLAIYHGHNTRLNLTKVSTAAKRAEYLKAHNDILAQMTAEQKHQLYHFIINNIVFISGIALMCASTDKSLPPILGPNGLQNFPKTDGSDIGMALGIALGIGAAISEVKRSRDRYHYEMCTSDSPFEENEETDEDDGDTKEKEPVKPVKSAGKKGKKK